MRPRKTSADIETARTDESPAVCPRCGAAGRIQDSVIDDTMHLRTYVCLACTEVWWVRTGRTSACCPQVPAES